MGVFFIALAGINNNKRICIKINETDEETHYIQRVCIVDHNKSESVSFVLCSVSPFD